MSSQVAVRNRILSMLKTADYQQLQASLEPITLRANLILYAPGDVISHIYFLNDAVVSLLFGVKDRRTLEVAMQGNEAAVGFAEYLGDVTSSNLAIVRNAGSAMRLDVNTLTECVSQCGHLQDLLHKSIHALVTQIAQASVCNRFHNVDARLARWLLMTHDRVGSSHLHATQDSIARMLGVRRSSVTAAASSYHKQHIINYSRGRIEILDQQRLQTAACSCYDVIKHQYDSFLN